MLLPLSPLQSRHRIWSQVESQLVGPLLAHPAPCRRLGPTSAATSGSGILPAMVATGGADRTVGSHRAVRAKRSEMDESLHLDSSVDQPGLAETGGPGGLDEPDEPGVIGRWIRRDPIRAVALALILGQLAWRAEIASRGFLAQDDFVLIGLAARSDLTPDYLLGLDNNHFMPAGMLIIWLVTRYVGLAYWPYVLLLIGCQAVLNVAFFRLLRRLVRPGWGLLVPLCVFLFSPLTLDATSMLALGMYMLPMMLAMVWAVGAQVKYIRTRRARHMFTLGLSMIFGLLFYEKSLLIAPLVFLVTACLFVNGGPARSTLRALRRYWPAWIVLTLLSAAYLAVYLTRSPLFPRESSFVGGPSSAGEVLDFLRNLFGYSLIPGLLGGPWHWYPTGDGPPLVATAEVTRWLSWAAFAGLVAVTIWLRRSAVRAWVLLAAYVTVVAALLGVTRLGGPLSPLVGLQVRYVGEVAVVAAVCFGIALLGRNDAADRTGSIRATLPAPLREPGAYAVGLIATLAALATVAVGAAWTTARYADIWEVKQGRDYLRVAQADLAVAPPGTVFFDSTVPEGVLASFFWPDNLQSRFFRVVEPTPVFVTEAERLSVFDPLGHVRPAQVVGSPIQAGPDGECGYRIGEGQTVRMPLATPAYPWPWAVWIGYLSSGDSPAVFRLGDATYRFQVRRGVNQIFFNVVGAGDAVELRLADPTVSLCTRSITVGTVAPKP